MKVRKQAMTANEQSTFDEMFNLIFTAATETGVGHGKGKAGTPSHQIQMEALGIGRSGAFGGTQSIVGLYDNLRGRAKNVAWTSDADEALDRKKEEMELCDTDQQLLEWAMQEVFGESQRYEAAAREAIAKAKADPDRAGSVEMPPLQPPAYSHLLAELMRTFRDKYRDPHLALSMFDHARHLSIPSYVFGCTTPAYNELIRTRWACFRDLRGVLEALEEMRVNGVEPDGTTRSIVENLRREVGERNLWEEHGQDGEKGLVATTGSDAVWEMLERIEKLSVKRVSKRQRMKDALAKSGDQHESVARGKKKWTNNQEWKQKALQGRQEDDGYEFGSWEENDRLRFA
ncbi:hypothetical protein PUNSTDRAFT_77195 [Punctularia strigosozonata HHB-11173 SS5]|uniref:Mtf2-like C-terminal domain-containing protein n=1 Tax=Punctularia strigosozonata (strain HHB-11173) TaxID=741275 RepID=R7S2M8_PUNST|nr:uncharacterized protein PUNSTDRAFT_77195 [Punctularia strigosozonata HHB-11173 SS5]EIN04042.1 hypothetical protein PUNSTDRAFT_77195 [Punctularia strigosozonata HHB-11173 SS5]